MFRKVCLALILSSILFCTTCDGTLINLIIADQMEPLSPDFTASVTAGEARLFVDFTDASDGEISTWEWDFDNDGTVDSTEQNPTHCFSAQGTFSVKLTVGNAYSSVETVKGNLIQVDLMTPVRKDTLINTLNEVKSVVSGDIDNDGDQDLIAGASDDLIGLDTPDKIIYFINGDGNGTSWSSGNIELIEGDSLHIVDMDKDGDLDCAYAAYWQGRGWQENANGLGTSWTAHHVKTSYGEKGIFATDLNKDGNMDLLYAHDGGDRIGWFENTGTDWENAVTIGNEGFAQSVKAAYIDDDNQIDVVGMGSSSIHWWRTSDGSGDSGTWIETTVVTSYISNWTAIYSLDVSDIDGDGDTDIISAVPGDEGGAGGEFAWWENSSSGSSWTRHVIDADVKGASIIAEDLDDDGDIDVAGAVSLFNYTGSPPVPESSQIIWWENAVGDGSVWTKHIVETDTDYNTATSIWAGDIDNDGALDLIAAIADYDYSTPSSPVASGGVVRWWEIFR